MEPRQGVDGIPYAASTPGRIRTYDRGIRNPVLYPAELPGRSAFVGFGRVFLESLRFHTPPAQVCAIVTKRPQPAITVEAHNTFLCGLETMPWPILAQPKRNATKTRKRNPTGHWGLAVAVGTVFLLSVWPRAMERRMDASSAQKARFARPSGIVRSGLPLGRSTAAKKG